MRVLVTGSSGRLGKRLVDTLAKRGHSPVGLDLVSRRCTDVVASILDRDALASAMRNGHFDGIIHAASLHRPQLASRSAEFAAVNVGGTRNMLELAADAGISRFVYTSTTAVMTSPNPATGLSSALWLTENSKPAPSDVYGETKLAAEETCRAWHAQTGMGMIILRPARFFHRDLLEHSVQFSQANHRANEFLHRRAAVEDVAMAHVLAMENVDRLKNDLFLVSAPSPFQIKDCEKLASNVPAVVEGYFPDFRAVYSRRGWKMYPTIDRVYVSHRIQDVLEMRFKETLAEQIR